MPKGGRYKPNKTPFELNVIRDKNTDRRRDAFLRLRRTHDVTNSARLAGISVATAFRYEKAERLADSRAHEVADYFGKLANV